MKVADLSFTSPEKLSNGSDDDDDDDDTPASGPGSEDSVKTIAIVRALRSSPNPLPILS